MNFLINIILPLRNESLNKFFLIFTKLGDWEVILVLFVLVSVLFWFYKKKTLIFPFSVTIAGSVIMTTAIKYIFHNPRPDYSLALYLETGPSFPSAHSALILAFLGFLIYCLWRFKLNLNIKIILTILFTLVIILIGFSRLYLGVHFLGDVLAGYLVGLMWVLIGMYVSRRRCLSNNWF